MIRITNAGNIEAKINEATAIMHSIQDTLYRDIGAIFTANQDPSLIFALAAEWVDKIERIEEFKEKITIVYNKLAPRDDAD